jgi:Nucleotidyl transferase AbiEii toxin, Type IV TA system
MPLQKEYYIHKLYPLQDAVLALIAACDTSFYLTGGTALSRWYLHHRFSDDLDFFVNGADDFSDQVERALAAIKKSGIIMNIDKKADDFVRIHCSAPETELKIDFVNDVPYHSGITEPIDLFPRLDGWWNILSNKITALDRREPKDVADILFLCRAYSFEWGKVFQEAIQKTTYIDPLDISVILNEFPKEYFSRIQWSMDVSLDDAYTDIHIIAKDILQKKRNSLSMK